MEKWIDTHAHYGHKLFERDRAAAIKRQKENVKYIFEVGTDTRSNDATIKLANEYDFIYTIIGYFPTSVKELLDENIKKQFEDLAKKDIVKAIGEIGLDYHWEKDKPSLQRDMFRYQIEFANSINKPICVHSRDAEKDTLDILSNYSDIKGVIHCYSYGIETAKKLLNQNFYFGIGGTYTYKGNSYAKDVIKYLPIENIVLETDAPYLTPNPRRKLRNESNYIEFVIELISEIKNIEKEEVIKITNQNAKKLFNI